MNETAYFDNIISQYSSKENAIIGLLEARGFFIDKNGNEHYVSDNATINDANYLKLGLEKNNLGTVETDKMIIRERGYHRVLMPYTAKVLIDNNANIDNVIDFFKSSGRISQEVTYGERRWSEFVYREFGRKCDVQVLEPYIAYYVKAISACGVWTNFSCDGNHIPKERVTVGSYYPYSIWQEMIEKYYLSGIDQCFINMQTGISINEANQYDIYFKIYKAAAYLYHNRYRIRKQKSIVTKDFNRKIYRKHNSKSLEFMFREKCESILGGQNEDKN